MIRYTHFHARIACAKQTRLKILEHRLQRDLLTHIHVHMHIFYCDSFIFWKGRP